MSKQIYFDYMATTPIDHRVIKKMLNYMGPDAMFGNPSSTQHQYGIDALKGVEEARSQVAKLIGANSEDIVFTSGATEANNLAILGAARFYKRKGKHLITMKTEHKSVLDSFVKLESEGFTVTYLDPEPNGLLDLNKLKQALQPDTILVAIMHVNNEIGVIQDIHAIGELLKGKGIIFHVDAAQSAGKVPINMQNSNISLMALSGHKNYGPKGVGALYIRKRPRVRIEAQSFGGNHEGGLRSGTLATHQIVGMGAAFAISAQDLSVEQSRIKRMRNLLWDGIKNINNIRLNSDFSHCIAGILNFSIAGRDGADLIPLLSRLAVSRMSACSTSSSNPSYVLKAIGLDDDLAKSSIRLSVGRYTTEEDIISAIQDFKVL